MCEHRVGGAGGRTSLQPGFLLMLQPRDRGWVFIPLVIFILGFSFVKLTCPVITIARNDLTSASLSHSYRARVHGYIAANY